MLQLEMLPVEQGDALLLEYGTAAEARRVLIDAGPGSSYENVRWRLLQIPRAERRFELLVVTHIDADHIEGVIKLLQDEDLGCTFRDVWFNDHRHLQDLLDRPAPSRLGPVHGEILAMLLAERANQRWNGAFDGERVAVSPGEPLPARTLEGGLELTVVGPGLDELRRLVEHWDGVLRDVGFEPGDAENARFQLERRRRLGPPRAKLGDGEVGPRPLDNSVANGSSIALLAEYGGHRLLLAGDALAPTLQTGLERWLADRRTGKVRLDAFKLPHHGSQANLRPELLELLKCKRYLVSTNGRHGHPDAQTIEWVLENHQARGQPTLQFNYETEETMKWIEAAREAEYPFEIVRPEGTSLRLYDRRR